MNQTVVFRQTKQLGDVVVSVELATLRVGSARGDLARVAEDGQRDLLGRDQLDCRPGQISIGMAGSLDSLDNFLDDFGLERVDFFGRQRLGWRVSGRGRLVFFTGRTGRGGVLLDFGRVALFLGSSSDSRLAFNGGDFGGGRFVGGKGGHFL